MRKDVAVFGIYTTPHSAAEAVEAIRAGGFRAEDVSVLLPENEGTKDFGHEKHSKAPEGATAGAVTAGALGGALGWLLGAGVLAIPGIGPFLAAGPIVAALAGVGAGTVLGGVAGALVGMGIPEYEAKRYEGRIRSGGVLLSVHCDDEHWVHRAKEMLRNTGAQDIGVANEAKADAVASEPRV